MSDWGGDRLGKVRGATRWWLVRHAPVVASPGSILGRRDVPADTSDAEAVARLSLRLPHDAVWLSSPLRRTEETAAALVSPGTVIFAEDDFVEQDFGHWQGLTHADVSARWAEEAARFWETPMRSSPPGGEAFTQVIDRVRGALARHSARHAGRDVVAVVHDGTIRAALCVALGCPPEHVQPFRIDTLSITRLDHLPLSDGVVAWRVMGVNCVV